MYLMYVDESGDAGHLPGSPTRHFILTGLVVHELAWRQCLERLIEFRRTMRLVFGLKLREEIHASEFVTRPGSLRRIKKHDRLAVLRLFAKMLATVPDFNVINVVVDKQGKSADYDPFEKAWTALIQRFENTVSYRNFSGPRNPDDRGMILPDRTDDKRLTQLVRRMRRWNPVPNQPQFGQGYRDLRLTRIIEDPSFRESDHSYFIQACDLIAYLLRQRIRPNQYMRTKSGHRYFELLAPILCTRASSSDPLGIVHL